MLNRLPPYRRVVARRVENGARIDELQCGHAIPGTAVRHRRRRCHRCHEARRAELAETIDRFIERRRRQNAASRHTQEEPDQ